MSVFALIMSILVVLLKIFVFGTMITIVLAFTLGPIVAGVLKVARRGGNKTADKTP